MVMIRVLRWGDYPQFLSGRNHCSFKSLAESNAERTRRREDNVTTETEFAVMKGQE